MAKKKAAKKKAAPKKKAAQKKLAAELEQLPQGLRNRNKEIRRVRVGDILDHPANIRTHPDEQAQALDAAVSEVGWIGYPDVFDDPEEPGKVRLVDGELRHHHLAAKYGEEAFIDVNVTDLAPAEAKKALLTKDHVATLAEIDEQKALAEIEAIAAEVETEEFRALLSDMEQQARDELQEHLDGETEESEEEADDFERSCDDGGRNWIVNCPECGHSFKP